MDLQHSVLEIKENRNEEKNSVVISGEGESLVNNKKTDENDAAHIEVNCMQGEDRYREYKIRGSCDMKFKGWVEGIPLVWKLDTGAVNTFITEDTYCNILPEVRPMLEHVHKKFHSADGNKLKILGTAIIILSFGELDI